MDPRLKAEDDGGRGYVRPNSPSAQRNCATLRVPHLARNGSCTVTNTFTVGRPIVMEWCISEEFVPLMLVVSGPEKYKLVASLVQAAEMLTVGWPIDDGDEYLIAIRACRAAIHGEISAQDARAALIRAADEAGISVITAVH